MWYNANIDNKTYIDDRYSKRYGFFINLRKLIYPAKLKLVVIKIGQLIIPWISIEI